MSDERITSRSPSPTLFDFFGIPVDERSAIPKDGPFTSEQNTSTPDADIDQEASTPATSPGTVNEDNAIQFMLQMGASPEEIVQFVKTHKDSKAAGNHEALDIISGVQTEELPERIRTVEARLLSTVPMHPTVFTPATIPTPVNLKRELSKDFDEKPGSSSQDTKRARTASMVEGPRLTKIYRRGCPGDYWKCKPELKPRTYWTSFKKFREHFEAHMEDHRIEGHRWKCLLCDHDAFGGDGYDLTQHLWDTHFE